MIQKISISTQKKREMIDLTNEIENIVSSSGIKEGICTVYVPHATAGITINENADPNITKDILAALDDMVSKDIHYLHDRIDGNARAHIMSSIIGPSETIPISNNTLTLGTWQNIFLCEFDGPRAHRDIIISLIEDKQFKN